MALEVKIRKDFGSFQLHIDFSAEPGVFALLGASGCGKSMTCKCIAGIITPDEGRIALNGRVLFDSERKINLSPQERHVGYMFQDYALFPNMTVLENVLCGFASAPERKRKPFLRSRNEELRREAMDLLKTFQIEEFSGRYPSELSGGQKQRCAMARIMAQKPEAILLDEPFAALDSYLKWQLEAEMKKTLSEMGKPTVFVSHNRDEVFHLADTVCALKDGRVEGISEKRAFFENPGTRTAALLSGCKNISRAEITGPDELYASDWGVKLKTGGNISKEIAYVGIRAHYLMPEPEAGAYELKVIESSVTEDPFEWTVYFTAADGGGRIQWKLPKKSGMKPEVPGRLYVRREDIMLLRG